MGLSREELVALGQLVPTDALTEWSSAQLGVARKWVDRLKRRGVQQAFLDEIATLITGVQKQEPLQERGRKEQPGVTDKLETLRDEGFDWWRETREIAKVEFGTSADALARFRTGVKTGGSTTRLVAEIRHLVPLLREHREQLAWLGANEEYVKKGETAAAQLDAEETRQEAVRKTLPPQTVELYLQKGRLEELVSKLVRIGRLEFRKEPEVAGLFNYEILRRRTVAQRLARAKAAKTTTPTTPTNRPTR